ncbi:hypothetical protein QQG09_09480 [Melissococcus plutonius]|nr:hypothetical protein [Melissococcus plutonius]AIM25778.1 hypothetical protein MEPL_c010430 [Melissococcus plutonius S1]KMT23474.1 hypothetical protein MEPL2_43p00560 [Melissococcus plutonius]KMT25232.1 hypothetical protein MEPL2_2c07900 [Melissococcus plutonius]KMT26138.1 hypothetical protein MEPL3_3c00630 [Melissococcus plutonius]KMT26868.1 hypothetical protein MEPL1_4c00630 [Melissococcus plutonius]
MKKYLLAALDDRPLYRTRKTQAICYVSLIANLILAICILYRLIGG